MKIKLLVPLFLCVCIGVAGCQEARDADSLTTITKTGVINYYPPPDNCNDYMIEIENQLYKPDSLSDEFKLDNLQVNVTYRISEKKHNCGFGGYVRIINIIKIKKV
jgi:hypothetical protein